MIIYNITCKVRWEILDAWLEWQLDTHIPATLATRLFDDHRLYRLLDVEEEEGPTFVIQFLTTTRDRYQRFTNDYSDAMQQEGWNKWGDKFIAFRTLMESV
jgi:hypothetical protein